MNIEMMYQEAKNLPDFDERIISVLEAYAKGLKAMEEYNPEVYEEGVVGLKTALMGYHFDEEMLREATSGMKNEDGSTGATWSVEQTNEVMSRYGIAVKGYNQYDINYTMNMLRSDYSPILRDDAVAYAKMAKLFLEDKDAPEGKALRYYLAFK